MFSSSEGQSQWFFAFIPVGIIVFFGVLHGKKNQANQNRRQAPNSNNPNHTQNTNSNNQAQAANSSNRNSNGNSANAAKKEGTANKTQSTQANGASTNKPDDGNDANIDKSKSENNPASKKGDVNSNSSNHSHKHSTNVSGNNSQSSATRNENTTKTATSPQSGGSIEQKAETGNQATKSDTPTSPSDTANGQSTDQPSPHVLAVPQPPPPPPKSDSSSLAPVSITSHPGQTYTPETTNQPLQSVCTIPYVPPPTLSPSTPYSQPPMYRPVTAQPYGTDPPSVSYFGSPFVYSPDDPGRAPGSVQGHVLYPNVDAAPPPRIMAWTEVPCSPPSYDDATAQANNTSNC